VPPDQPGLTVLDAPGDEEEGATGRHDALRGGAGDARDQDRADVRGGRGAKRERLVARRVRRVVRRLDPWSVLKVSLVFYLCCYVVTMVAGVLLWNLAERADVIAKTESFIEDMGAYQTFEFLPGKILSVSLLVGAVLVIIATGLTVLATVFFNLISDLVGGVRVVVIEEESARPRPTRPDSVTGSGDHRDPRGYSSVGSSRPARGDALDSSPRTTSGL
jgi:hypothetical protein